MDNLSERLADEYLVLRAQEGDVAALEALLVRWQKRFWLLASNLTNTNVAQDILQDSMIAMTRSIRRLKDPARFQSWAYRIVSNKSRDWIRSNQRREHLKDSVREEEHADESPDVKRLVRDCLEDLPADQRAILTLFYLEGMAVKEIATVLDLAEGTVKSRLFHARANVKSLILKSTQP